MSDLTTLDTSSMTNDFATIPAPTIDPVSTRILPRQTTSGVTRGTQTMMSDDGSYVTLGNISGTTQFGIAFYDPNGNLISTNVGPTTTVYDSNGKKTVITGLLADGTYGIAFYDVNGNLIRKINGATQYTYDPTNGNVNITQDGQLPDGTHGWVVATTGKNVTDGYL